MSGTEQTSTESQIFNFPVDVGVGVSVMETFERMCLGSALTGFVVLIVATLVLVVAG
jgi:hypothetical protein